MAIINGTSNNDQLLGTNNEDTLRGARGSDTLLGGSGNDKLFGGRDSDQLFGNIGDDYLSGGVGNDILKGGVGNDILIGREGTDRLFGGRGDDTLRGSIGGFEQRDTLFGGLGNDTYLDEPLSLDRFVEKPNGGIDTIIVSPNSDYFLSDNIENLTLVGSTSLLVVFGNDEDNVIIGSDGSNILSGLSGDDTLIGGAGQEVISGGAGNDVLAGGAGSDRFIYNSPSAFNTNNFGVDTITEFTTRLADFAASDQILLSITTFTAITSTPGPFSGFTVASEFESITGDESAAGSAAFIVYNTVSGNIFYNENGTADGFGTGGLFATITQDPNNVTALDFTLQP